MNAQENIKNDEINFEAEALTDLPVTDEQDDGARGGIDQQGRVLIGTDGGLWR